MIFRFQYLLLQLGYVAYMHVQMYLLVVFSFDWFECLFLCRYRHNHQWIQKIHMPHRQSTKLWISRICAYFYCVIGKTACAFLEGRFAAWWDGIEIARQKWDQLKVIPDKMFCWFDGMRPWETFVLGSEGNLKKFRLILWHTEVWRWLTFIYLFLNCWWFGERSKSKYTDKGCC